jgi:hypothetical protein
MFARAHGQRSADVCLVLCASLAVIVSGCGGDPSILSRGDASDVAASLSDQDGDGIADVFEGIYDQVDTDGDGQPDYLDADSDDDGIDDASERGQGASDTAPVDSDNDGTADFRDTDSDANGIPDSDETTDDLDEDGLIARIDLDDDGDALSDAVEIGVDPAAPVDSDGDGTADFLDQDSDGDGIGDLWEGEQDLDEDGAPNYLDGDSDGDCRSDTLEGGRDDPLEAPLDSDGDGVADFQDLDSDNDGLLDRQEDADCDAQLGDGETSPLKPDSDGDGATDLVEIAAGTNAMDADDSPQARGDFVFVVPFEQAPSPTRETFDFASDIVRADVVLALDTTASMDAESVKLRESLRRLTARIGVLIPDIAFGVVTYRDFPFGLTNAFGQIVWAYGARGDYPFRLEHRVMTVGSADALHSIQLTLDQLRTGDGEDAPESGFEMLYQLATGSGRTVQGFTIPAFDDDSAAPATIPAGEETGTIGGVGFRQGALPIVVWATDACNHNAAHGLDPRVIQYQGFDAATETEALAALETIGARVLTVVSNDGECPDYPQLDEPDLARRDAKTVATATNGQVPPSAWGEAGSRPAACAVGQCCTGLDGRGEAPDARGNCPLVFRIDGGTGAGLGDAAIDAVRALAGYGVIDIAAVVVDDSSDSVDTVAAFVGELRANPEAGGDCSNGLTAVDREPADGVPETFDDVQPGKRVCFDIVPKTNTTVEPTSTPQLFRATIEVKGDGVTDLDSREVYFLVPPRPPAVGLY